MLGLTLSFLNQVGDFDRLHVHPSIPASKLTAARHAYGTLLPRDEVVMALYDNTAFGSGRDGFVITAQRICWRNAFVAPSTRLLSELKAAQIQATRRGIQLDGQTRIDVEVTPDIIAPMASLLQRVAGTQAPAVAPVVPEGGEALAAFILKQLSENLSDMASLHIGAAIPPSKKRNVEGIHGVLQQDQLLALYDDTVFGSGKDGFVITERHIAWKNIASPTQAVAWRDIDPRAVAPIADGISVGRGEIMISGKEAHTPALCAALKAVVSEARRIEREGADARCEYCDMILAADARSCTACGAPR